MGTNQHGEYLANQVLSASPGQLVVLAYDGALRFARVALEALKKGDIQTQSQYILRSQGIVMHLLSSLDSTADPRLSHDLSRIYVYIHGRLTDANVNSDSEALEECIKLLSELREAWAEAENNQRIPLEEAA